MKPQSWWRRIKLRDLVFFTLPALLMIVYIYCAALARTAKARQFDDWWSRPKGVYHFAGYQVRGWMNVLPALAAERRLDAEVPDASALRLDLPRARWDQVSNDPLSTFGIDFPASLLDDGDFHPIELRVRGDTSAHWSTEKISFTLRTKRRELWRGHRRIGYSCKRVLPLHLAATLARDFDLLAPRSHLSPVYFNDRFYGLYRALEIPDESFLRRQDRLPGNIFRGDTAERGEVFKNLPRQLFRNPYIWDLVASDGKPAQVARAELESLVRDVHDSAPGARERLLARFDTEEIGRLMALLMVVGDLHHMSDLHNNFWYRDPSDGKLHPIPWDIFVRSLDAPIGPSNLLVKALLREPAVLETALRYVHEQLEEGELEQRIDTLVRGAEARHADAFAYDRLRKGAISDVGTSDEVLRLVRGNLTKLRRWIADSRVELCVERTELDALFGRRDGAPEIPSGEIPYVVDLTSRGFAGADLSALHFGKTPPGEVGLWLDSNRNGQLDGGDLEVPAVVSLDDPWVLELAKPIALLPAADPGVLPLGTAPLHYRLFLCTANEPDSVRPVLHNRITGARVEATEMAAGTALLASTSWHPWDTASPTARTLRWSGTRRLDENLVLAVDDELVLAPGTTVELGPEVSLFTRGRIRAEGTAEQPIVFTRADPAAPWGSLGLIGHGADGSRFAHCRFVAGAGGTVEGVELKGMVSVHRADGVVFDSCEFRDNVRCDDTLNVVHSSAEVRNCSFANAHGDAIDFDISSGLIADCRFERSRNDAIDLMTSSPQILNNVIEASGDKGISIGESSHPLVFNNVIRDCERGVEIKDSSHPLLVHNRIEDNRTGVFQQRKNWRYGSGGLAVLVRSIVSGNDVDVQNEPRSRLTVVDSVLGDPADDPPAAAAADLITMYLLAASGIDAPTSPAGLVPSWSRGEPAREVDRATFRAGFDSLTDGWHGHGAVDRLAKRNLDLELKLTGPAAMSRAIDWNLSADRRHIALLEIALPLCTEATVSMTHDRGKVKQTVPGSERHDLVAIELEPGRYSELRIAATPQTRQTGRVLLHGYRIYSLPR